MINVGSLEAKAFQVLRGDARAVIANGDTVAVWGVRLLEGGEQQRAYAQRQLEMWLQGGRARKT